MNGEAIHTFTWKDLQNMASDEEAWVEARLYSTINTWPTKKWYTAEGVKLTALLGVAGVNLDEQDIQTIVVRSTDGFTATFTKKQLFDDERYYFPGLKDKHEYFGHIPGSVEGKEPVDAIIALRSVEDSDNPAYMTPLNCPLLVVGQHYVTEQTNHTFVKNVGEVDLLTKAPQKWASPTATPEPGTVPAGTKVELKNEFNDADKIHYTTDGTEPTLESPIYNWIASRWWSNRKADLDEINKPIEITEDTVIKAKTIGLGREDSDIVTFEYKIETVAVTGVNILEGDLTLKEGETVQLNAVVEPENATNRNITWSTGDAAVATVDEETGLVTAVSEGEATITVTTEDGNFTDSITVTVLPAEDEGPKYDIIPEEDSIYTIGETEDGIKTMTVNDNQTGLNYFTVSIESIEPHEGTETVIFAHIRDGVQLQLNALEADFDEVSAAKAGFNVKPGDVIKVYIVDKLTNDSDLNPIMLQ